MKPVLFIQERFDHLRNATPQTWDDELLRRILEKADQILEDDVWDLHAEWKYAKVIGKCIEYLGVAHFRSGDERYARRAVEIIRIMDRDSNYQERAKEIPLYDDLFLAEMVLAVLYCLEFFENDLEPGDRTYLEDYFVKLSENLWQLISTKDTYQDPSEGRLAWNHSVISHAVLALCALKRMDTLSTYHEWIERAVFWVQGYISFGFTHDGVCREGIFYAGFTREPLLRCCYALQRYLEVNLYAQESLRRHMDWLLDELIPARRQFIVRNDSADNVTTPVSGLLYYAWLYREPRALGLWQDLVGPDGTQTFGDPDNDSNGNGSLVINYLFYPDDLEPVLPAELPRCDLVINREAGVVNVLSSVEPKDFFASFQATKHVPLVHSQADHGQLYVFSRGDRLLIDAGAADSRTEASPSQAEGHGTLLIDGKGQSRAGKGWLTVSHLGGVETCGNFVVVHADLTQAYNFGHSRTRLMLYQRLVVLHKAPPYLIIQCDYVVPMKLGAHMFAHRFHTDHRHGAEADPSTASARIESRRSAIEFHALGFEPTRLAVEPYLYRERPRTQYVEYAARMETFLGAFAMFVTPNKKAPLSVTRNSSVAELSWELEGTRGKIDLRPMFDRRGERLGSSIMGKILMEDAALELVAPPSRSESCGFSLDCRAMPAGSTRDAIEDPVVRT